MVDFVNFSSVALSRIDRICAREMSDRKMSGVLPVVGEEDRSSSGSEDEDQTLALDFSLDDSVFLLPDMVSDLFRVRTTLYSYLFSPPPLTFSYSFWLFFCKFVSFMLVARVFTKLS